MFLRLHRRDVRSRLPTPDGVPAAGI